MNFRNEIFNQIETDLVLRNSLDAPIDDISILSDDDYERVKKTVDNLKEKGNVEDIKEIEKILIKKILYIGMEHPKKSRINVKKEFNGLRKIIKNEYLKIEKIDNPTIENIVNGWEKHKPKIVLFSCHGDEDVMFLANEKGEPKEYRNSVFLKFFQEKINYTECVILSSCESKPLGKKIFQYTRNVICINSKVDIGTTLKFNELFFKYLDTHKLSSYSYKRAFDYSTKLIRYEGLKDSFSFDFYKAKIIN